MREGLVGWIVGAVLGCIVGGLIAYAPVAHRVQQRADSLYLKCRASGDSVELFLDRDSDDRISGRAMSCDSLSHLADSLRDRRTYWYWRAHTKGCR